MSDQRTYHDDKLNALVRFGAAALRAGNTATRTREKMQTIASKLDLGPRAISLTFETVIVSIRQNGQWITASCDCEPVTIDAWQIAELEQFADAASTGLTAKAVTNKLAEIGAAGPRYGFTTIAIAIGAASSGFAFLNGAGISEVAAAGLAGAIGHWARVQFHLRVGHPFGVAMLSAVAASSTYVLIATIMAQAGLGLARHPAGFVSALLFLVPGFPLIAGLFDLLQGQTTAALSRLAYGFMVLLVVAFGLSIIVVVAEVDLSGQAAVEIDYPVKLALRGIASIAGGCAFAMLFNSPPRVAIASGFIALVANEIRLILYDVGLGLAPAALFGALVVGLMATIADWSLNIPRITLIAAPIVIMIPGINAFEAIVLLQQGAMLDALQAATTCGFAIAALAMGLTVIRLVDIRKK